MADLDVPVMLEPTPHGTNNDSGLRAWFHHWRSGKLIKASDYGYKGFPIGKKKKRNSK